MQNNKNASELNQNKTNLKIDREDFFADAFDFYGIGKVATRKVAPKLSDIGSSEAISIFRMTGDELGTFVVGTNSALLKSADGVSMLTEIANIAIGKFVSQLADATSADVILSPPEALVREDRQNRLLFTALEQAEAPEGCVLRTYDIKLQEDLNAVIHIAFLASQQGVS